MEIFNEYNLADFNSNYISNEILESIMANENLSQGKQKYGGLKFIFEFPTQSFKDEEIKSEIKSILNSVLQEHIQTHRTS